MDKKAAARIYDLYFNTVYKVCFLYMRTHADAQDMTQETFCQMLLRPFRYETDEKAKAWLIVTASNLCKNQLKRWWVKNRVSYDDTIISECIQKDITEVEYQNIYQTVIRLDAKYAIPTYLYYYEGYKTGEIADLLHQKQSTIQTRLAKARELLKLELEHE